MSELDHKASKQIMDQLLTHTIREFEQYAYRCSGGVDARRWKKQSSRDDLTVYRERKVGTTGASVFNSLRQCRLDLPTFSSTVETLASPTMLLTGHGIGRVEDAMSAIITENQQDLALVVKYKHQDVADCAIIKTIESPTQLEPYNHLSYKFFVRKSPTDGRLMKHRHSVYLESCGMTHTSTGEKIGFHIMHSVELRQFPDLTSYNSIRALQSTRYLFRQKSDRVIEVFMLGNMDISGRMFKPLTNMFTVDTLVGVTRLMDLAEVRRLSQMAREQRRYGSRSVKLAGWSPCKACGLVVEGTKQKLLVCRLCGDAVCGKCTTSKRVFLCDDMGILGDFKKVQACTMCVLRANTGNYLPPHERVLRTPDSSLSYDFQESRQKLPETWPRSAEHLSTSAPETTAGLTPAQNDMMSQLFELSKMAEATSTRTQLNGIYCEQHWQEELKVEMEAIESPELRKPTRTWI
ncbi:hypothetical protein BBO99_00002647 [Phytophthora kernoviae]|uniref:FYVE-type domain-containing protein n=2 Tax=Phytophthora kernoviae TaxID=325452 RepID=A0A3R7IHG4_9STRA|nr:hypothetical protein G195_004555 [Phytophthora kernoviae 00238/432]KAG2526925.1 hypothetical protein JM16_002767 [Phytophthora kernoviae]KAG2528434.1 hypothetical protein JM18_002621 [Phytophthora kernoviae]RLN14138.1 hypothetical protein BBI17_002591 [Phytophthora kernoviae]RLN82765.1 hypothetical protein BBO99_00002647 [Phytophthora kernoviae]